MDILSVAFFYILYQKKSKNSKKHAQKGHMSFILFRKYVIKERKGNMIDEILYQIDKLPPDLKNYFETFFGRDSESFLKQCTIVTVRANERFVHTGDILDKAWICISGTVKVMEEFKSGETYIYAKFSAPEIFGEMETVAGIPIYRSSLIAETDCIFIVGPTDDYINWIKKDAVLLYSRMQHHLKHFMEEGRNNRTYLLLDATERIKLYFLDRCAICQDGKLCILKNTRQQIADETGYSVKTVNRVIKKLAEQGLLVVKGQGINITNVQYIKMLESIDEKAKFEQ